MNANASTIIPPNIAAELAQVLQHKPLYIKYAAAHIDPETKLPILVWQYIASITWNESTGNRLATNPGDPSWGLMGLTIGIARHYGSLSAPPARAPESTESATEKSNWKTPPTYGYDASHIIYDPETNIAWGSAFLADLKRKHGQEFPLTDLNTGFEVAFNEGEPNEIKHVPDPKYAAAFLDHLKWIYIYENLQPPPDVAAALAKLAEQNAASPDA